MKILAILKKLLFSVLIPLNSNYDISLINPNKISNQYLKELKAFEVKFTHPFNDKEQFRIEHGKNGDYFSFFKHLGNPYFYVAICKENKVVTKKVNNKIITVEHNRGDIAAVSCSILRNIKNKDGKLERAWYICDLRVNEKYQGKHLPMIMARKVVLARFLQCPRGFGICMNPLVGMYTDPMKEEPKAVRMLKKYGSFFGLQTQTLNLYMLNYDQTIKHEQDITSALIKYGYMRATQKLAYTSTSGMKDYIIFDDSSSRPWHLLHIRPANKESLAQPGAVHMICSIDESLLDSDFKQLIGVPTSTAQIVSIGMQNFDFNFLISNQI